MINAPRINELTISDRERQDRVKYALQILNYNVWFEYSRALEIFDEFDVLYFQACHYLNDPQSNPEIRPLSLFISGEYNTGKTTLVIRYMNICELIAREEERPFSESDILYFETPVRVTLKRMFAAILTKFGKPIQGNALRTVHTDLLIDLIIDELKDRKVKLLIIDEIQRLLETKIEDKRDIFSGLKKLVNQTQTRLILVGTPNIYDLFKGAKWVEERFRALKLSPFEEDKEWLELLKTIYNAYKAFLPDWDLVRDDGKVNGEIGSFFYALSGGRIGTLIQIIRYGAVSALLHNRTNPTKTDYKAVFNIEYNVENGQIKTTKRYQNKIL